MTAQDALKKSTEAIPTITDREYKSLMKHIESATEYGDTSLIFGYCAPSESLIDRLKKDGYTVFYTGGKRFIPKLYSISWAVRKPKKSWLSKIFGKK